jgi:hypothetical protein
MKISINKLNIACTLLLCCLFANKATAQTSSNLMMTESFKVQLACETNTCKKNFEGSIYAKGIRNASWDLESKVLTITFDPQKVTLDEIRKRVDQLAIETSAADTHIDARDSKKQ